jgi:tetratricopeptide (TPR) repeat protein
MDEKDPDELVKKAQKKLDPGFFKAMFSDTNERAEKAIRYYTEAAEIYKIKREWIKAADCYMEIANLKEGLKEDQTESFNEALLCYNKGGDTEKDEKITNRIINIYVKNGEFSNAGELVFEKAKKLLEKANGDEKKIKEILELYEQSLDYYQMDKNAIEHKTNEIKEAKADLIVLNGIKEELSQAKHIYEELAQFYSKSKSGNIFSKDYYAKIIFIYLAYEDFATAKAFLNKYYEQDGDLYKSDIASFLENLIACMENNGLDIKDESNVEVSEDNILNFDIACQLYKKKIKFNKKIWDNWKIVMVDKIGKKIQKLKEEKEKEFEDDEDLK